MKEGRWGCCSVAAAGPLFLYGQGRITVGATGMLLQASPYVRSFVRCDGPGVE